MNWPASCSVLHNKPLACSSWDLLTRLGSKLCAVLSRTTSAAPSAKQSPVSSNTAPVPCAPESASAAAARASSRRQASASRIRLRRSKRSASTPAGRANSSQGNCRAAATRPISKGSRVSRVANQGKGHGQHPVAQIGEAAGRKHQLKVAVFPKAWRCHAANLTKAAAASRPRATRGCGEKAMAWQIVFAAKAEARILCYMFRITSLLDLARLFLAGSFLCYHLWGACFSPQLHNDPPMQACASGLVPHPLETS